MYRRHFIAPSGVDGRDNRQLTTPTSLILSFISNHPIIRGSRVAGRGWSSVTLHPSLHEMPYNPAEDERCCINASVIHQRRYSNDGSVRKTLRSVRHIVPQ
jgi:hypothetical protein